LCAATHLPLPLDLFLDSLSEVNPRPLSLVDVVCTFTDGSNYAAVTMPEGKDRLALVAPLPLARRPSAATVYFDLASHRAPAPRPAAELIELRRSWAQVGHKLPSKEEQRLLNNLLQFLRDARDDVAARALEAESRSVPELRGPRPNRFLQRLCDEVRALQSSLEDRLDAAVSKENVNENEVARLCAALWKVRLYLMGPPA
jgi:hypothetical protein